MKRIFGFLSLLLTAAITFANPIDFDKAFKESKKMQKQTTSRYLAMKQSTRQFFNAA